MAQKMRYGAICLHSLHPRIQVCENEHAFVPGGDREADQESEESPVMAPW